MIPKPPHSTRPDTIETILGKRTDMIAEIREALINPEIFDAVMNKDVELANQLINLTNCNVNLVWTMSGSRLLHLAVSNEDIAMTGLLLSKGANPHLLDLLGISPAMLAVIGSGSSGDIAQLFYAQSNFNRVLHGKQFQNFISMLDCILIKQSEKSDSLCMQYSCLSEKKAKPTPTNGTDLLRNGFSKELSDELASLQYVKWLEGSSALPDRRRSSALRTPCHIKRKQDVRDSKKNLKSSTHANGIHCPPGFSRRHRLTSPKTQECRANRHEPEESIEDEDEQETPQQRR